MKLILTYKQCSILRELTQDTSRRYHWRRCPTISTRLKESELRRTVKDTAIGRSLETSHFSPSSVDLGLVAATLQTPSRAHHGAALRPATLTHRTVASQCSRLTWPQASTRGWPRHIRIVVHIKERIFSFLFVIGPRSLQRL